MDRLLLQWWRDGRGPDCGSGPGDQALLCEGLRQRAAGTGPAASWHRALEASGLVSGSYAYRRPLVEAIFGPGPEAGGGP